MRVFLAVLIVGVATAAPSQFCKDIFPISGLSKNFNETIAHAIHSLTVEGLRIFHPQATSVNHIPTVNHDLRQPNKVLSNAPSNPIGQDFETDSMNVLDNILSNLGSHNDGLGPNWSGLERVAHSFHMWDLWMKIFNSAWKTVKANPPHKELCKCVLDVENNGIKTAVGWVANHYKSGTPITLLNRAIPKLVDATTWTVWKNRLLHYYTDEALKDAATYLHCATQ
ncbi:uncharacterized protein [Mytilus edulis]|uniref:Uncharacterized protein n=2 Tax=Mytilus TaxID=6548 RepID=A0A8B6FQ66_MYTGA|nr:unnamed protein product [Mytilus edulis]VDI53428.1 Hypothetical predicted protein [Mytilus galloprovincialis]